jgi:cellulose synthase operon protein C
MCAAPIHQLAGFRILALGVLLAAGNSFAWSQTNRDRPTTDARRVPDALNFANGLVKERRYDMAAEEYEKFLKSSPNGPDAAEARYSLANTRLFLGQYQEARKQFEAFLKLAPKHPNAPTAWFRVGEVAHVLNDLAASRKALETYTTQSAGTGHRFLETAWLYLGEVYFALGELPSARQAFERAEHDFPKSPQADRTSYGLARTLAALGKTEDAVTRFEDLARRGGPEWADKARYQVGLTRLTNHQYAEAAEAFAEMERSAPRSPQVPEARLRRAEALLKLKQPDDAERLLRPLVAEAAQNLAVQAAEVLGGSQWDRGQPVEARATWDAALKRFPNSPMTPSLLMRLAEADRKEDKPAEARTRYLKIVDDYPKDPSAPVALVRVAGLMLEAGDAASAKDLAASFSTRFPESSFRSDARLIEARAALALKKPKDAIALLEAEPKPSAELRYLLGRAYLDDGQKVKGDSILESLSKSPDAGTTSSDALFIIGQKHFDADKFTEALEPLQKYLADKPKGDVAADALAYLALSYAKLGQDDESRKALEQLAKEFPGSKPLAWVRVSLAAVFSDQKAYARAEELLRPVAEGPPSDYRLRARSDLGWALLLRGRPGEAAEVFEAIIKSSPSDPSLAAEAARGRGRALDAAGKTNEALVAYQQVIDKYPTSPEAATAALAQARVLLRAERPAEASAAFERFLKDYAKGSSEPPAGVLIDWGIALLEAEKSQEAERIFRRVLTEYPDNPRAGDARVQLAVSARDAGSNDEVIRLLEPVVAEGSKSSPATIQSALFLLGRTQAERKDWAAALTTFSRLASEYRDGLYPIEARFWKAESLFKGGDAGTQDAKAAELELSAFIEEFKSNPKADDWVKSARLRRVQCQVLLLRWDEALSGAQSLKSELANDDPRLAEVEFARGRALQSQARPDFDASRSAFDFVIKARAGTELAARAQLMRGETYFHQKDYREALREYLKVDILYKNAPRWQALALLEAGKVEEERGRWSDAADLYQKLRSKYPNDPNAAEAARRFAQAKKRAEGQ